jgi:small-conductance mechanosensitive channel
LALVVVICRNTFIPDILLNILFTPILLVTVFAQLTACTAQRGKVSRMDNLLGWVSLGIYVIILMVAFFGYTFAALIYLMWWYFMFAALLTVLCVSDLADRYKDSRTDEKSWLYDFVRQVFIPSLLLLSLPWSAKMALGLFDFTDLYTRYFYEPFLHLGEEADGPGAFSISVISIVWLSILFCFMRFLNQALHELWRHVQYASFKHRNKRTQIRANEINLSLGNSIISVVVWLVYAIVIIQEWKIPTGSLGLVAGGLSAGIGIALKDTINNFIYGIQLMSGRLRVGDFIECDGVRGKVESISYQSTQITTLEGAVMAFTNTTLFNKNFKNLTRNNSYEYIKIGVGVGYGTPVEKVRGLLEEALGKLQRKDRFGRFVMDPDRKLTVVLDGFGDSSVDLAIKQYVLVEEEYAYIAAAKEIIYNTLSENGIEIPFPQRDIHVKTEK